MKKIDYFQMHQVLHRLETEQLKEAVKNFGGTIHFGMDYSGEFASGTERPCIVYRSESGDPCHVYINAISITDDVMEILAEDSSTGSTFIIDPLDIMFGEISFITDFVDEAINKYSIWLRLGVSVSISEKEAERVIEDGDGSVICQAVREGRFGINGDTYIPDVSVENFNNEYGTDYKVREIDLF